MVALEIGELTVLLLVPLQNFGQAVAEAKEVLDKRAGRKPATNLDPIDFLDESAGQDEEALPQQQQHAWMRDPTDEEWQSASTASCLAWIRAAATISTTLVHAQPLLHILANLHQQAPYVGMNGAESAGWFSIASHWLVWGLNCAVSKGII